MSASARWGVELRGRGLEDGTNLRGSMSQSRVMIRCKSGSHESEGQVDAIEAHAWYQQSRRTEYSVHSNALGSKVNGDG